MIESADEESQTHGSVNMVQSNGVLKTTTILKYRNHKGLAK